VAARSVTGPANGPARWPPGRAAAMRPGPGFRPGRVS